MNEQPSGSFTVSVFDLITGEVRCCMTLPPSQLAANVPRGCGTVIGYVDGSRRRVNPDSLEVEPFIPPSPSADHTWNTASEAWEIAQEKMAQIVAARSARASIDALERQQARAIREHAIGRGGTPAELKKRLEDIDDQITALRATLTE
jgi:hypothetical protein